MRLPVFSDWIVQAGVVAIDVCECLYRREWREAWAELRRKRDW